MIKQDLVRTIQNAMSDHYDEMTAAEHYFLSRVVEMAADEEDKRSIADELISCIYAIACKEDSELSEAEKTRAKDLYVERFDINESPEEIAATRKKLEELEDRPF